MIVAFVCQKSCCDASKFKIYLKLKGNRSWNSIGWSHANLRITFQLPFIIWKVIQPWCVCCKWSQTESNIFAHVVDTGNLIQCHNKLTFKLIYDLKDEYFQGISVHILAKRLLDYSVTKIPKPFNSIITFYFITFLMDVNAFYTLWYWKH